MCNACIIENVKSSMLSRRSMFRTSAAAGLTAVAAGLIGSKTAIGQSSGKVVDLTYAYDRTFPTFDGKPGIEMEKVVDFAKDGYTIYKLTIFEHTGVPAPISMHRCISLPMALPSPTLNPQISSARSASSISRPRPRTMAMPW